MKQKSTQSERRPRLKELVRALRVVSHQNISEFATSEISVSVFGPALGRVPAFWD